MKPRVLLILATVLAFAVTACAGGAASSPPGSAAPAAGLDGRTFLSRAVSGRALVAGSTIRLSFKAGSISASAGCNSMSGTYSVDGNVLRVGMMATTEMACQEPLMAQDRWLADLLDGATIALDGNTLTLAKGGVTVTLVDRVVADPDRPLLGTRWIVDGLISGEAVSSVPVGVIAALTFDAGQVAVETGCNSGGGSVTITDRTIAFGSITLTKKGCPRPGTAVELAVTAVLQGQVGYTIEAGRLTLTAGERGLLLRAQP